MNDIKVTIEKDGSGAVYSGEFVVVGIASRDGEEEALTVAVVGGTTAYASAMLGCQVVAKLVEPFDTMERVSAGDEV